MIVSYLHTWSFSLSWHDDMGVFSEWDVVYCSIPTSPGGGYRSALGRLFFKTKEMIQAIEAPDTVLNKVSIRAFGFLDGEVSLKGMPSTILLYEMEYPYLYGQ